MTPQWFALLLIGSILAVYLGIALAAWVRLRGTRVVTCPETHRPAAVTLDTGHVAFTAVQDEADLRLATCTRWPERQGCDQVCVRQIAETDGETRPSTMIAHFFEARHCAICRHPIHPMNTAAVVPGFVDRGMREVIAWDEVPPEQLPDMFTTHRPVCADCTLAESFRRRFPDRVVDRIPQPDTAPYDTIAENRGFTRHT
jgi:hypothetical protein